MATQRAARDTTDALAVAVRTIVTSMLVAVISGCAPVPIGTRSRCILIPIAEAVAVPIAMICVTVAWIKGCAIWILIVTDGAAVNYEVLHPIFDDGNRAPYDRVVTREVEKDVVLGLSYQVSSTVCRH